MISSAVQMKMLRYYSFHEIECVWSINDKQPHPLYFGRIIIVVLVAKLLLFILSMLRARFHGFSNQITTRETMKAQWTNSFVYE
jgi:hypothetical protein